MKRPNHPHNSVSRREVLQFAGAVAAQLAVGPAFAFAQTMEVAHITITDQVVGEIGARFAGLSYEKSSMGVPRFRPQNEKLIGLFRRLGPSQLRIGGNTVDYTGWDPNGSAETPKTCSIADIRDLREFLDATGWTVLYGVNMGTSHPSVAAEEVAHAVDILGPRLAGIEIGNECDLYRHHYFNPWNLQEFERIWEDFRQAILARTPRAVLTGPASAGNVANWTVPFGKHVGKSQISLLTQHYYRGNGQSPSSTYEKLISPDPALNHNLHILREGAKEIGIPFRMAETNSFYNGGRGGVSNSYASTLWILDYLFANALGGSSGVNMHGGGNGPGYSPIADANGTPTEARPEFYGMELFTEAGQGQLLHTSAPDPSLLSAYTVRSLGKHHCVLVNKQGRAIRAMLHAAGGFSSAESLHITGPSLQATNGVKLQGESFDASGSIPELQWQRHSALGGTIGINLAPYSAALVRLT